MIRRLARIGAGMSIMWGTDAAMSITYLPAKILMG
jgi:hypothetical protein